MMDRTDRHFRFVMRRITRRALLYTEMITTGAILHGDRQHLLGFHPDEHPVALQLGGDDPGALAEAARIVVDQGYDEVNLNVGCPSDRVQRGRFGACLMLHPEVVADGVAAMRAAVDVEVTVKHRIGVDDHDTYDDMERFVRTVAAAGCRRFTVHARKAWLQGLSPRQNREIPPLRYDEVVRLKREHPELEIEINGGIRTADAVVEHLGSVDAVMIGRAAVDDPWLFADLEARIFGEASPAGDRFEAARAVLPYLEALEARGEPGHRVTRHLLTLFAGQPGGRVFRRLLTEGGAAGALALRQALDAVAAIQERAADRGAA
ncbi:MAG: tRNA dihydrouridine(20/20a) synthase DusA [Alphaproteobacteria bacterium]|nr:tRNA dihydrouridine(20/20a) synthase DusA [Alphaproteobacteria bacterium]